VGGIDELGGGKKDVGREMGEGERDARGKGVRRGEKSVGGRSRWTRWGRRVSQEGGDVGGWGWGGEGRTGGDGGGGGESLGG
jgi:hypothetical protein